MKFRVVTGENCNKKICSKRYAFSSNMVANGSKQLLVSASQKLGNRIHRFPWQFADPIRIKVLTEVFGSLVTDIY